MVVRVREITNAEGNKLRNIVRHGREPVEVKRAQVILASAQGFTPPKIGVIALMSEDYVRDLIHAFNECGMEMLKPKWRPGGSPKFTEDQRQGLVSLATSHPKDLNLPYAEWSLSRLREEAMKRKIVPTISTEWLRVILHEAELSHQSIRTWKETDDPEVEKKKRRIERLTRKKHNPPTVLSMDETGPIPLIPQGGEGWFEEQRPGRIPAEYSKTYGRAYYFLCLNVYHQRLSGRTYLKRNSKNWLALAKAERSKYPADQKVYLISDNLSTHKTKEVVQWARESHTTLVFSATHSSWMNPVETHGGDLQRLALPGTHFTSVKDLGRALDRAVTYRNRERKKRGKRFRDTVRKDRRRRAETLLWKRVSRTRD